MRSVPISPRPMAVDTSTVLSVIALQYNPASPSRSLQIQSTPGGQDGTRVDALRLRGPAIETIKLEAELDAIDQLEFPKHQRLSVRFLRRKCGGGFEMSRINLTIDQIVLRGFEAGDRKALLDGLQTELSRVLADPADGARWASSRRTPVLKLGRMPVASGPSGSRNFGARVTGAIGNGLKP